ncbi:hypothetical protein HDU98_011969 [Podochytrium sp. JEL0797]|nr:hypothetical protein HDU98_011969 [Podochytrium sp. JEL0797]
MKTSLLHLVVLLLCACFAMPVLAWEKEDLAIFDLHDKVVKIVGAKDGSGRRTDFYQLLSIPQTAKPVELSRAYRKASLENHPDKNPSKEAAQLYALLTSVHGVLKDKEMRERYDKHLAKGIPTWRGTGYYIARYKPGLAFILTFVVIAISVSQYIIQYTLYYLAQQKLKLQTTGTVAAPVQEKTADDLSYNNLRRMLKKAGHAEPPATVKTAIRKGIAVAEILKMPEMQGLITEQDQKREFEEEAVDALQSLDQFKPSVKKTLVYLLPQAVIGIPAWVASLANKKAAVVDSAAISDDNGAEDEENELDELPSAEPRLSKKAAKLAAAAAKQSGEDTDASSSKPKKKKKAVLKSSTGVVMTKAEFLKMQQDKMAKAKAE